MAVDFVTKTQNHSDNDFDYFWRQQGEWVEEPNQRRGGESGVQRVIGTKGQLLYVKRQVGHTYRSFLHPLGRQTVLRERDALRGLRLLDVGTPELVFCGSQRGDDGEWRGLLVTAALEGFVEIDTWYATGQRELHGEAVHQRLLETLAGNLARMHRGRWQHSCLYMKHIFVRVTGDGDNARTEVALLDLEKCRQRLSTKRAAMHDMKQLRRHSSWNTTDWDKLGYFYEKAFGSAIKGLR